MACAALRPAAGRFGIHAGRVSASPSGCPVAPVDFPGG